MGGFGAALLGLVDGGEESDGEQITLRGPDIEAAPAIDGEPVFTARSVHEDD